MRIVKDIAHATAVATVIKPSRENVARLTI